MTVVVRDAMAADMRQVVQIHQSAFPGFLLTELGPRFLARMYRGFSEAPGGILLVAQPAGAEAVGLLAGTSAPESFFGLLRRRHGAALAFATIPALLLHPLRVGERVITAARYRGDRPRALPGYWLLSSLGVSAGHAGRGVGSMLVDQFCQRAEINDAAGVYLLTDREDNDAAKRFYEKRGFGLHAVQRRRDGREMLVMVRSFTT